ncbi:MAG TPA: hypothetical protein VFH95_13830 [Candidatus Kapabacteria bacterium]|nr:hypothetical protein [Candidatus Kapabacteria bacterium]
MISRTLLLTAAFSAIFILSASKIQAQDTTRSISVGPELLVGGAFPQSSTLKPITAYQIGVRSKFPLGHSDWGFRLEASYRHLEIQWSTSYYQYEFEAGYFFLGPALQYKWFELGVDVGVPTSGNFNTFGGQLADTSVGLSSSEINPLIQIAAAVAVPIAETDGNRLSLLFTGAYGISSQIETKYIILHPPNSREPVAQTGGALGPISTLEIGLTYEFSSTHPDDEWK